MTDAPGWKSVLKINAALLKAVFGIACGWGLWHLVSGPGSEFFRLIAALFFVGGAKQAAIGLFETCKFIQRTRRWARFRRLGASPKADPMAKEADLRGRGLLG